MATLVTDLSKTFDTTNHSLLLKKLYAYSIHGNELWFTDYLAERYMRVVVDEISSEWAKVSGSTSGFHAWAATVFNLPNVEDAPLTFMVITRPFIHQMQTL